MPSKIICNSIIFAMFLRNMKNKITMKNESSFSKRKYAKFVLLLKKYSANYNTLSNPILTTMYCQ